MTSDPERIAAGLTVITVRGARESGSVGGPA